MLFASRAGASCSVTPSVCLLFRSSVSLCQSSPDRGALPVCRVAFTVHRHRCHCHSEQANMCHSASPRARRPSECPHPWCKLLHKQPVNKATHRSPWSDRPSYRQKGSWFVVSCLSSGGGSCGKRLAVGGYRRQSRHKGIPLPMFIKRRQEILVVVPRIFPPLALRGTACSFCTYLMS